MLPDDALTLISVQERSYSEGGPGILESYPKNPSMDAERITSFLQGKKYAVLATSRPDGRPQAAPIAFTVWKAAFWIASVKGARVRNLRFKPYASIVVIEGEGKAHRAVIAEGPVKLHPAAELLETQKVFAELWQRRNDSPPTWAYVFIELRPERLFSYDVKGK